jgi:transposase
MTDAHEPREVFVGVDTHADVHHAAVIDPLGARIADQAFPATATGYRRLYAWSVEHGVVAAVGMEGTGSYGAGLSRHLRGEGLKVIEVDRPDRKHRRIHGKSDPMDAYAAAEAVASGRARGLPKDRDGIVESIRCLHVARRSAVKARTQAINQMRGLITTGPEDLREAIRGLGKKALISRLARLRPGSDVTDPATALKVTVRGLARRCQMLNEEIATLDRGLAQLTAKAAPQLLARPGIGVDTAGQLLITAGDNPDRLHSEAAFAHLTGSAPIPASSGRTDRHRLNRGGDRQANRALYIIAIVRMRRDPRTQAYVAKRTAEGLKTKDILRCLKRSIAREVYRDLNPERQHPAAT